VKVDQGEQEQNQVVLNIEVEHSELEEQLDSVYRRVVQRTSIPGFRKGKAPRSVVERFVGREALLDEALESLLPKMTSLAIQEKDLDVVAPPRVKVTQQDPLTIEATVPLRPPVDSGDYQSVRLEPEPVEVNEGEVDQLIESIRMERGVWEPVDRNVEIGDLVTMNVKGDVEGESIIDNQGVDYVLAEGSPNPLPGFPEQLVGSGLASELEFSLTFPEDYLQAEMAGKDCNFTVYIEEIKERKMPELDEEFIQSLNMDVQDETGLKDKLQEDIHQQKQMSADRGFEEQVIAKMVECAQMELPPLLVDEEIEHILGDQAEALRRQQLSMDAYLATVGKSVDELREEARPMAVERLTRTLAMQAFREKEGIDVAQNEIEDEIEQMLSQSTVPSDSFRDMLASEDGQTSIKNMLLNRKTIGRLTEIAKGETTEGVQPVNEADPEGNLNQEELERGD